MVPCGLGIYNSQKCKETIVPKVMITLTDKEIVIVTVKSILHCGKDGFGMDILYELILLS